MFNLRTVWEHKLNQPLDIGAIVLANVMRTKNNASQLIIGTLTGELSIIRVSPQFAHQDQLCCIQTGQPIIGVMIGSFSAPYVVQPSEQHEKLEIAIVHPGAVQVYAPKRSATADVQLQLLYSVELGHAATSFCACNRRETVLDENKNKRLSIHTQIAVKTINGILLLINSRQIQQKITLSQRYALPSPIAYNALADQLIISTFEYELIGLSYSSLLHQQSQNPQILPAFELCVNCRIQQLETGRYFFADSGKAGEVCAVLNNQLLWFDDAGKIIKELKFDDSIISISNVLPVQFNKQGKHPVVLSLLVLLQNQNVAIVQNGIVKWRGVVGGATINHLEFQKAEQIDNQLSTAISHETSQSDDKPIKVQDSLANARNMLGDMNAVDLPDDIPKPTKNTAKKKPLAAVAPQIPQLNKLPWPIIIQSPTCLASYFTGNSSAPQLVPQYPGLFLLSTSDGDLSINYFGTSVDQVGNMNPINLPSIQESKQLKDDLSKQLLEIRSNNEQQIDPNILQVDIKLANIQIQDANIVTTYNIALSPQEKLTECTIGCGCINPKLFQMQFIGPYANNTTAYINELHPMKGQYKLTFNIIVKKGQFVSAQQLYFAVQCNCVGDHSELMKLRFEKSVNVPLLSYCIFDVVQESLVSGARYSIALQLEKPFTSLAALLQTQKFSEQLLAQLKQDDNLCLSIYEPNGQAVALFMPTNYVLQLQSNSYETFFLAFDFLQQYQVNFTVKYNQGEFIDYFSKFNQNKSQLFNQQKQQEDFLIKQVEKFNALNNAVIQQFFAQQNPLLNFTLNSQYIDVPDQLSTLQIYISQLICKLQRFDGEINNYDEKIRGLLCLLSQLQVNAKDANIVAMLREACQVDVDQIEHALQHVTQRKQSVEQQLQQLLLE